MNSMERKIHGSPQDVWDVLADGWLYPLWVVGATRMRAVDDDWPEGGARLHHSVGVWPAVLDDNTEVVSAAPPRRLELRAKGWPFGEADVVIEVEPDGAGSLVRIHEEIASGPGRLTPAFVRKPLINWRNSETLRRLALIVEGRSVR